MDSIFSQCYSDKTAAFSPHSFLHTIWCMFDNFANPEQHDAHEFMIAVLTSISSVLTLQRSATNSLRRPNGFHEVNSFSRIYTGILRSEVRCVHCSGTSVKFEEFLDVSLDVARSPGHAPAEQVAPTNGEQNHENQSASQSLATSLRSFTSEESLHSTEQCYCSRCGGLRDSAKRLSLHRLPPVLCIHLKRFKHTSSSGKQASAKIDDHISFPLHSLNLSPYTSEGICLQDGSEISRKALKEPRPEQLYDLFGVVVHKGASIDQGHYISYVRRHAQWYSCDDTMIVAVSEDEVRASKAYMLCYIQKKVQ